MRRMASPAQPDEEDAEQIKQPPKDADEDDLLTAAEACFSSLQSRSLLAHHLLIRAYVGFHEHALLIPVAESGLSLISSLEPLIGKRLHRSRRAFQIPLATSLVKWEAPKHHLRATRLVEALLEDDIAQKDAEVLMAKAALEVGKERWAEAEGWFGKALEANNIGEEQAVEARSESAWCRAMQGRYLEGAQELEGVIADLEVGEEQTERSATRQAKAYYRLGRCRWLAPGGEGRDVKAAYAAYIKAIKRQTTFAPAFTALGVYYLEAVDPPDYSRASKCFQKAFELDPTEDLAARKLAEEFAEDREWDLVEVVARRVLDGTGGASALGGPLAKKLAWAWLALGSAELAKKRFLPAVAAFQSAVRGAPSDPHAWLKLGLAYRGAGKHIAALKTFAKATELAPDLWWARFCVGDVQRAIGLLDAALAAFEAILDERPDEVGVRIVLAETRYTRAMDHLKNGYISRAETNFVQALEAARIILEAGSGVRIAWKIVGDVFTELGRLRTLTVTDELRSLFAFFVNAVAQANADGKMPSVDAVTTLEVSAIAAEQDSPALFVAAAALAYKIRVLLELHNEASVGSAWLDLGLALARLKTTKGSFKLMAGYDAARRQSIQAVRFALQHEPANAAFWNVLGVLSFELSPRLAQHAFIKSVEHNERSPVAWTNLAYFYLAHSDHDLANQAFLRAQTNDPEWTLAWLGQALLAAINGDARESAVLVEHAFTLSAGSNPDADLSFATTAFEHFSVSRVDATTSLSPAFFAVSRVLQRDASPTVLHLHALLAERLGQLDDASASLEKAAELLEARYEEDESPEVEARYVMASANLGRVRLAMGDYKGATEAFETVLSLRPAQTADDVDAVRVQALMGIGLAKFFDDDLEGSLTSFQTLLDELPAESVHRPRATLLLARVLWALGGDEQRQEARQVLFDVFGSASGSKDLAVVATLAAIAVVEGDDELLEAAVTEITGLSRDKRKDLDPEGLVDDLLLCQHLAKVRVLALTVDQDAERHCRGKPRRPSLCSHPLSTVDRPQRAPTTPSLDSYCGQVSRMPSRRPSVKRQPHARSSTRAGSRTLFHSREATRSSWTPPRSFGRLRRTGKMRLTRRMRYGWRRDNRILGESCCWQSSRHLGQETPRIAESLSIPWVGVMMRQGRSSIELNQRLQATCKLVEIWKYDATPTGATRAGASRCTLALSFRPAPCSQTTCNTVLTRPGTSVDLAALTSSTWQRPIPS